MGEFGTYIWTLIVGFRPMGILLDMITEVLLKEALLCTPLMASFWCITGMVTLGADDFLDFLLGFLVDFLIMLSERTYLDPWLGYFMDFVIEKTGEGIDKLRSLLKLKGKTVAERKAEAEAAAEEAKNRDAGVDFSSGDTVEPILGAYSGYSGDAMGLPYALVPQFMMFYFPEASKMMDIYGIKSVDMQYYIIFSIVVIPFQYVSDILCLQVLELTHGWKIYDYLVYTRYRFLQRETRWKGLEDSLDECIEEGMRTLDQMCFSSQYYLMVTVHTQAIMEFIFGIECILRVGEGTYYNIWGDTMTLPLLIGTGLINYGTLWLYMRLIDKIGIYRLKHEDTAWHSTLGGPEDDEFGVPRWDELDKIKGASHEAYLMNQKITSETFRFRFLRYNRPWLVNQLPNILTPRTLRRSRPYLIAQLTKILGSVNPDVSSDSDSDDDGRPQFGPVSLNTSSRSIARLWLAQARRRKRLRVVVQPLISRARRGECEKCLSRKQLQVMLLIPIEVLGDRFEKEYPSEEFDKVAWKNFFNRNAKFKTLCLSCIQQDQEIEKQKAMRMQRGIAGYDSDSSDEGPRFGPVYLNAAATAIILKWKQMASDEVRRRGGRTASAALISDDDSDDDESVAWAKKRLKLNAASKALAIRWLRMARAHKQAGGVRALRARESLAAGRSGTVDKQKTYGKRKKLGNKKTDSSSAALKSRRKKKKKKKKSK